LERRLRELGVRRVSKRGGSLQVTIPTEVLAIMRIETGDRIVFYYDEEAKRITLGKVPKEDIEKMITLEFSVSRDLAKRILQRGPRTRT
jgi:bifunctional DNA-binding transcriptional regulator/antitoxin component of YhaV-PrlF toxin-antitoxin module